VAGNQLHPDRRQHQEVKLTCVPATYWQVDTPREGQAVFQILENNERHHSGLAAYEQLLHRIRQDDGSHGHRSVRAHQTAKLTAQDSRKTGRTVRRSAVFDFVAQLKTRAYFKTGYKVLILQWLFHSI